MLDIIIILLAAYIVAPLADLSLNERTRVPVKIAIYLITLIWILYTLIVNKVV